MLGYFEDTFARAPLLEHIFSQWDRWVDENGVFPGEGGDRVRDEGGGREESAVIAHGAFPNPIAFSSLLIWHHYLLDVVRLSFVRQASEYVEKAYNLL